MAENSQTFAVIGGDLYLILQFILPQISFYVLLYMTIHDYFCCCLFTGHRLW